MGYCNFMPEARRSGSSEADVDAPVEMRVAADLAQLSVVRAMAETVAVLNEFNLDEVSDVKLAVDQICSDLIADAIDGADLTCRFQLAGDVLWVRVSTDTRSNAVPDTQSFGWHVLRALTDSIAVTRDPLNSAGPGYRTTVELTKLRIGT